MFIITLSILKTWTPFPSFRKSYLWHVLSIGHLITRKFQVAIQKDVCLGQIRNKENLSKWFKHNLLVEEEMDRGCSVLNLDREVNCAVFIAGGLLSQPLQELVLTWEPQLTLFFPQHSFLSASVCTRHISPPNSVQICKLTLQMCFEAPNILRWISQT